MAAACHRRRHTSTAPPATRRRRGRRCRPRGRAPLHCRRRAAGRWGSAAAAACRACRRCSTSTPCSGCGSPCLPECVADLSSVKGGLVVHLRHRLDPALGRASEIAACDQPHNLTTICVTACAGAIGGAEPRGSGGAGGRPAAHAVRQHLRRLPLHPSWRLRAALVHGPQCVLSLLPQLLPLLCSYLGAAAW